MRVGIRNVGLIFSGIIICRCTDFLSFGVQDWYGDYDSSPAINPTGPSMGSYRVRRGGSWSDDAWYLRAALRYYDGPGYRFSGLGFRPARSLNP